MDWLGGIEAWHWLALGLVLLVAELSTGSTYLLWPAAAAWIAGLLLLFVPLAWPAQLTIFAAATIVLTLTGRHYVKGRWLQPRADTAALNAPDRQLVGAVVTVTREFENGIGRVRLGDSEWRATCEAPAALGARLQVVGVDGATLIVRPVPSPSP